MCNKSIHSTKPTLSQCFISLPKKALNRRVFLMFSGNKKCNISLKGVKDTREENAKEKSVLHHAEEEIIS